MAASVVWQSARVKPVESVFDGWSANTLHKTWTVTGSPGSSDRAFVSTSGTWQPRVRGFAIYYFIYDRESGRMYSPTIDQPKQVRRSLLHGYLPAPCVGWNASDVRVESTEFISGEPGVCFSRVVIRNVAAHGRRVFFYAAALPYQVMGGIEGGLGVEYDRRAQAMLTDGKVLFACDSVPDAAGALAVDSHSDRGPIDVSGYIRRGLIPSGDRVEGSAQCVTSGAVRYDLDLGPNQVKTLVFRAPVAEIKPEEWARIPEMRASVDKAEAAFSERWQSGIGRVKISLPDRRFSDCFYASLAYLMIMSDKGVPKPGPCKYHSFWLRDGVYIADALHAAGREDLVPPILSRIRSMQQPGGGFSFRGESGLDEHDAPGEAIYALVQWYRGTGDKKWLAEVWPAIAEACKYIRTTRLSNPSTGGIMPKSVSAEDLGKGLQIHYWDDFWCIRGLKDAVFAARVLGKTDDAAWVGREARALKDATYASIGMTARKNSIKYIPNGPNEVKSSAMARGTSCGMWPCEVLDPADLLVRNSYEEYWKKWIAPWNGGFVHKDHFWPYAGLDLAQGYLRLGEADRTRQMLRWTLDHDPTHGFYSWPEGMFRDDLTLAEGDMPHGWMCASYISLMHDVLVRERGDDLMLLSGIPREWLMAGRVISVRGLPTVFGIVSFKVKSLGDRVRLSISGAKPRGNYIVVLPGAGFGAKNMHRSIENRPGPVIRGDREVRLPSSIREVTIPLN